MIIVRIIRSKCPSLSVLLVSLNVFIFIAFTYKLLPSSCRRDTRIAATTLISKYKRFENEERKYLVELKKNEKEAAMFRLPEDKVELESSNSQAGRFSSFRSEQSSVVSTKETISDLQQRDFPVSTVESISARMVFLKEESTTSSHLNSVMDPSTPPTPGLSTFEKIYATRGETTVSLTMNFPSDETTRHVLDHHTTTATANHDGFFHGEPVNVSSAKDASSQVFTRILLPEDVANSSPALLEQDQSSVSKDASESYARPTPYTANENSLAPTETDVKSLPIILGASSSNAAESPNPKTYRTKLDTGETVLRCQEPCLGLVNVYLWYGIFDKFFTRVLHYNDMFPRFPQGAYFNDCFWEEKMHVDGDLSDTGRRFTGYFTPDASGEYQFLLESRDGSEFILIRNDTISDGQQISDFLLRINIGHSDAVEQDSKLSSFDFFKKESSRVHLEKDVVYVVDLCHVLGVWGGIRLSYKRPGDEHFVKIHSHLLRPIFPHTSLRVNLPPIFYMDLATPDYIHILSNPRTNFHSTPFLNLSSAGQACTYKPSYVLPPDFQRNVTGFEWVLAKQALQYPIDAMINNSDNMADVYMNPDRAEKVIQAFLDSIIQQNFRNFSLQNVVHLEENREEDKIGKRYFIEVDVTDSQSNRTFRASKFIFVDASDKLCSPKDYIWNSKQKIFLLTVIFNQEIWVRHLVHSLNEIASQTGDYNLHLIVVDYNSTDANVQMILDTLAFNYSFVQLPGRFNKAHGLNVAASMVPGDHLMFILDLHLRFPNYIFDQIRKHTFRGMTVYCPILRRLYSSQHPAYSNMTWHSLWQEQGFGMISMFKSDWDLIGGMDEVKFGTKWGGEDWDIAGRIVVRGLELIHDRWPGYWHIVHRTKGTWDGTKLDV